MGINWDGFLFVFCFSCYNILIMVKTKFLAGVSAFLFCFLVAFVSGSAFLSVGNSSAESTEVDIIARVHDVISITTDATDDELPLYVNPTPSGTLVKNQLTVMVSTNNSTGYTLNMNSITTNTSMVHESATGSPLSPNIPSTSHPYNTPAALTTDTWGWNLGTASSASTFKKIPPSDDSQTIRTTDAPSSTPSPDSDTIVTFAVNITDAMAAGAYINTMVFTATTNYVPPVTPCKTGDYECILFTISTTDGTYSIPTSGRVADMNHTYDWDVYVDNALTTDCPSGNCTGTSNTATAPGVNGITLTGLSSGQHQIKIVPHAAPTPGWGNAFGHYFVTGAGANTQLNKDKLISLDSPLTTMAFAPKTSESTANASNMFANIFTDCTNLTTPATFVDTYKLPGTITNLSYFLSRIHSGDTNLTTSIDLTPLSGWFDANTSITNLSDFLTQAHIRNSLLTPINLAPLSGWFNANNSITNLSAFLTSSHTSNNLSTPIDLAPLAGWFNANTSITDLSYFLQGSHQSNANLSTSIDLIPLSGWFAANTSVTNLSNFLRFTHAGNNLSTPINLTPIANWFNANNSITNLSDFLTDSHYSNTNLNTPINLDPLSGWFNANTSITNLSNFLSSSHGSNTNLNTPINLAPLSSWFNANTSITDLSGFLSRSHSNNNLSTPINLAPLSSWFNANTSITNLSNFLGSIHQSNTNLTAPVDLIPLANWFSSGRSFTSLGILSNAHYNNPNLTLSGQTIFPDWIKTATENGTPIWNVDSVFLGTFRTESTKAGDTGEPKFQDGSVLSSLGTPTTNTRTYYDRSGITPVNPNWK